MKTLIEKILKNLARKTIEKYKPTVIGITGSQGKTSVRITIASMLEHAGRNVRTPDQNYNNEFGFPLAILGMRSPGRSSLGWLKVLFSAHRLSRGSDKNFPDILVLEYGADKKGDIDYLVSIAKPDIAVLTGVSAVHSEKLGSVEEIAEEKSKLGKSVEKNGLVIVNGDDAHRNILISGAISPFVFYGFSKDADVVVENMKLTTVPDGWFDSDDTAARFSVLIRGQKHSYSLEMKNVVGKPVAMSAAAAIAIAEYLNLDAMDVISSISNIKSAPGRMSLIKGIRGSLILDDSYNASPAAMKAAIETLAEFDPIVGARRIAALGYMAELGRYSENEHRSVGTLTAEMGIDVLLCIGEPARDIARAAIDSGMKKESVMEFSNSQEAGRWLDKNIVSGDVILIKGSQSSRMEKTVKDIMADPLRASDLLVRQYGNWLE
jgi:UDP-N-acetylmuramoyl-tripeptide--D-alanyl-D-alanine ligase